MDQRKKAINPPSLFNAPALGFSQAVRVGDTVYCSGQVSYADTLEEQTREAFNNVRSLLAYAGARMVDIVKVTSTQRTRSSGRKAQRCATSSSRHPFRPRPRSS
jgi:enamine deaminase RidA (YjgF/YER057c/UK114 family)